MTDPVHEIFKNIQVLPNLMRISRNKFDLPSLRVQELSEKVLFNS